MRTHAGTAEQPLDRLRLAAGKTVALRAEPYLGPAIFAMKFVAMPHLGTFAVDKYWRCYVDPACVDNWSVDEIATVLRHEVRHLLYHHAARAERVGVTPASMPAWNIAADAAVNPDVDRVGRSAWPFKVVMPASIPGGLPGMLAEELYALLSGDEQQPDADAASGLTAPAGPSRQDGRPCGAGSGVTGIAEPFERPPSGDHSPPAMSEVHAQQVRRQVAQRVNEQHARQPGRTPRDLVLWASAYLRPQHDWRRELRAVITTDLASVAGRRDYSSSRPSRRWPAVVGGVVLPGMTASQPPRVDLVVDTSGSMRDRLDNALAEVEGILATRTQTRVIFCDAQARTPQRGRHTRDLVIEGGGGTDMGAGLKAAAALKPRAHVVVVITDMETPWPAVPYARGQKIIVCGVGDSARTGPPWAKYVHVEV